MPKPQETPLSETTFYILLSLRDEPRHGYAILKDIQRLSENRITVSTGTLYGALKRLLEQAWIMRQDDPKAGRDARQRKVYALTETGQQVLTIEASRLRQMVRAAEQRLTPEAV